MAVSDIILLLEFSLKNTYFSFQDQFYEQVWGCSHGFPRQPYCNQLYMEFLEQKALGTAPNTPRFWHRFVDDIFVIHKEVNKQDFLQHINSVDPAIKFTVEDTKEDGSIPFLDTIVNLRLMAHYPSLCTGNPHIQTSTCHGTVTITSQPNLVSSTPCPIGPQQCVASMSCLNKKRTTSGRLSPNVNIPNGLWTRWRKDSTGLPVRSMMGLTTKALQLPNLSPMKLNIRVILSFLTHKVFVKVWKRSVVDMAFKPTSKVAGPSKPPGLPQGQRPYGQPKWCHLLVPMWWPRLWWGIRGGTSRTFGEWYKEHLEFPSAIHHHSSQTGHPLATTTSK